MGRCGGGGGGREVRGRGGQGAPAKRYGGFIIAISCGGVDHCFNGFGSERGMVWVRGLREAVSVESRNGWA